MPAKRPKAADAPKPRSPEQQFGSAVFARVIQAWEDLTDEERLTWNVTANSRRTTGIRFFRSVNLRRLRRGEELARLPPQPKPFDARPLLKRLYIFNRCGRITLALALSRVPAEPTTVWGSLPCNRGLANPHKCPRLGPLPRPRGKVSEISALYFNKHGDYIREHHLQLVGKRIFIRLRRETDIGATFYEQVAMVVPPPEPWGGKKTPIPS